MSVVATLLMYEALFDEHQIEREWFTNPECSALFDAMSELRKNGETIAIDTVELALDRIGKRGLVRSNINEILNDAGSIHTFAVHVGEVGRLAIARREAGALADASDRRLRGEVIDLDALRPAGTSASPWLSLADVEEESVPWLWEGWIPCGELVLFESLPKLGKSTLARGIAAAETTGAQLPGDTSRRTPRHVIWISLEEHLTRRLIPALRRAGANMHLVVARKLDAAPWTVDAIEELRREILRTGARLVVIDGLKDVLALRGEEREVEVRAALLRLQRLAHDTGATIIGIRHWRKSAGASAIERGAGSIAYSAIASSIITLGKHAEHGIVVGARSRCAADPTPRSFRIVDRRGLGVIEWGTELVGFDIDDLCRDDGKAPRSITAIAHGVAALRECLVDGDWHDRGEVIAALGSAHTEATVKRAAKMLGVEYRKPGYQAPVQWRLSKAKQEGTCSG